MSLVFRVQAGEFGLICLKRSPKHKLHDCQHADTESQQVREAFDLVVELDKQRRDMHAALEAVKDAFNTVFVAIAQHRLLQRQPLWRRIGDKGLPAKTLTERGDGVDRKSTRLNSSHGSISYAVFCLKKKKKTNK